MKKNFDITNEPRHTNEFYRKRIKKIRRKNPNADTKAQEYLTKRRMASFLTNKEMKSMSPEARNKELKRQYDILSGKHEKAESTRAKENLMKMLNTIGLTQEQLDFVNKNISRQWIQSHPEEFEWWFGSIFKETYYNENGRRLIVQDEYTKSDIRDDFWSGMMNLFENKAKNTSIYSAMTTKAGQKRAELMDKWQYAQDQKNENNRIYLGVDHEEKLGTEDIANIYGKVK